MADVTLSFNTKYPKGGLSLGQIMEDMRVVAASKGEACFHAVDGALDVVQWMMEQDMISATDTRVSLAHIWGKQVQ